MIMGLAQLASELKNGIWKPLYLVVGAEAFQAGEVRRLLKSFFLKDGEDETFQFEAFDGENIDVGDLLTSLQTLPGLFGTGSTRLVYCQHFDKIPAERVTKLESYWEDPCPSTCFLIWTAKVDKRTSWYRSILNKGAVIEIREPYDREWPKWRPVFEKRTGKTIDLEVWERLVENANRSLSLLATDLDVLCTYSGESTRLKLEDMNALALGGIEANVFSFAEVVLKRLQSQAVVQFHQLQQRGESEIKILAILIRQFKLVEKYLRLTQADLADPKRAASLLGIAPFFVSKIASQARSQSLEAIRSAMKQLTLCDYNLKTGMPSQLFDQFLVPYFTA